jgi:hypothetical protein
MVYILTRVGGEGCPVLNGHVTCVALVFRGTSTGSCLFAQPSLRLGHTIHRCLCWNPGLCVRLLGSPTFFWLYGIFTAVYRFVLGS